MNLNHRRSFVIICISFVLMLALTAVSDGAGAASFALQPGALGPRYIVSTSAEDPLCDTGFDGYIDLEQFGIFTNPSYFGDTVLFEFFGEGDPINFYGETYETMIITDDGFAIFDPGENYGGEPWTPQTIPDGDLSNNLAAIMWQNMEIIYDQDLNRGVSAATSGDNIMIVEFDDIQTFADPSNTYDLEIVMTRTVDDAPGAYEIVYAYNSLNGTLDGPLTVGVENADGDHASSLVNNESAAGILSDDLMICFDAAIPTVDEYIDVWYGDTQHFGQSGNPQQWVNILGNVDQLDAGDSLTYSLNGGVDQPLSIGPDGVRLQAAGDYNVEIDYADLNPGENEIVIKASDGISETEKTLAVNYTAGQTWPTDYSAVWNSSSNVQDIAQVVDGSWRLVGDSVIIDENNWGYNRLLAVGDETWTDYEVTVPITVYGLDPAGNQGVGNGSGVGLVMRWLGHNNVAGEQPNMDWERSGALGWYRWTPDSKEALELRNRQTQMGINFSKVLEFDTPYIFKMSVQSVAANPAYYRLKFWKASEDEPFDWDIQGYTSDLASEEGSLLLVAHHVHASFGEVTVKDLAEMRLTVDVTVDGAGSIAVDPDQADFGYAERVRVLALPDAGYDFAGWSGDYTGSQNPAEFIIFRDMNLTATFVPKPPQLLTVDTDGEGSVSREPDKTEYDWGEEVILTAEPGEDTIFLHWSGDLSGRSNPTAIIMDGDKEVTAVFGPKSEATPKSDNFGQCELDTSLWTLINPAGDAELNMTGTEAQFTIPAGTTHDMWPSNADALRIMQPTLDQNFEVEVKFVDLPAERYQMEGILIQQDDDNWLRFDIYFDGSNIIANAAKNDGGTSEVLRSLAVDPGDATNVYLRVERNGDSWNYSYSFNGVDWTVFVSILHEMQVTSSGLFVGNAGTAGTEPAFNAQVDYFMNTAVPVANPDLGSITIEKQADDLPDSTFEFAGDFGRFSLAAGESKEFSGLCAAGYMIREVPDNEWVLGPIECDSVDIEGNIYAMTVNLQPGEDVTCSFVNNPRPPSSENVEFVGHIGGNFLAVAVQGNYAYVGDGPKLSVLDISDPSGPVLIGSSVVLPEVVWDVEVEGDFAYVAAGLGGLRIIDITDPAAPVEVGYFYATDEVFGLDVKGNLVYIADGVAGLRAIDVNDPTSPIEVGALQTPGMARDVEIAGDYAYVANYFMGLRVIDISNPDTMHEVGSFVKTGWDAAWDVAVFGNKAYLAYGGLHVIDIADPQNPAEYGFYESPGTARGVFADEAYAYLADSTAGLIIIDGSIPGSPPAVGTYNTSGPAVSTSVSGDYAYVAADHAGLHIVDISSAESPTAAGAYETAGGVGSVAIAGDLAYFATTAGLNIFDVSNPTAPAAIGFLPGYSGAVAVSGNYAFVAALNDGLYIIDVTDPVAPFETGAVDTPGLAGEVAISGNYAYIADRSGGLRVIDVSDPTNPLDVTGNNSLGDVRVVAIAGTYAYIGDMDSGVLRIVDITDPTAPIETGFYDLPDWLITDLVVAGNYAYVANGGLLRIIDVSNPNSPTEVGNFVSVEGVESVYVDGNYAYVADGRYGGLRVAYISNPEDPQEVGFYDTPGHATGVTVANDYAFVGDSWAGLIILQYTGHGSITIQKQTSIADAASFAFAGDLGSFVLNDGASEVFAVLEPGDYTINEEDTIGWYLDEVECDSEHITDLDGGVTIHLAAEDNITCTFSNRRLTVEADAGGPYTGSEGEPILMDGGGSSHEEMITWYRWDCTADGSWDETSRHADDCSCTYADNGTYTLRMRTVDIFHQTNTATTEVKIENVAPEVDAGVDQTAVAGTEVRFAGSYYDPGTADSHTIKWDFGDGSTKSGTLSPTHIYPNTGQYKVTLTVTDNDGGKDAAELTVDVVNSAPTLSDIKVNPEEINEGDMFILSGSISDSSTGGTLSLFVDWGDGQTVTEEFAAGTETFSLSHICVDDAPEGTPADSFTINLKLSDDEGAFTTSTAVITVNNVAPTVDAGPDQDAIMGQPVAFSASITDPGLPDTHSFTWDFGDGSSSENGAEITHSFTAPGEFTVTVTVEDDDGGIGQDTLNVVVNEMFHIYTPLLASP